MGIVVTFEKTNREHHRAREVQYSYRQDSLETGYKFIKAYFETVLTTIKY